jgi:hypothetical protein
MNPKYVKLGNSIIDISKISFISPLELKEKRFSIVIDGYCVNINSTEEPYIRLIQQLNRDYPILEIKP